MQQYGLLNSDEGVFPEYIRNFLMTAFTLVTQLCMMNLSILVIVNGKFDQITLDELQKKGVEIFQRNDVGYNFLGYKYGLEILGADLEKCDELVICDSSTYGPLYSLSNVFNKMAKSDCDFWGITAQANTKLVPSHIQSYFVVFRKKCFLSNPFKKFWAQKWRQMYAMRQATFFIWPLFQK